MLDKFSNFFLLKSFFLIINLFNEPVYDKGNKLVPKPNRGQSVTYFQATRS